LKARKVTVAENKELAKMKESLEIINGPSDSKVIPIEGGTAIPLDKRSATL